MSRGKRARARAARAAAELASQTKKPRISRGRLAFRIFIIVAIIAALAVFGPLLFYNRKYLNLPPVTTEQLDELHLENVNKLMIVAHPDDEFIWGGAHLLEDDWFVVVLTNGGNKTRRPEFEAMMKQTGDIGLILSYPDKVGGKRSNWDFWSDAIRTDLETIISYKDWAQIVTHNESGEYGHQHHIATHRITVAAYENLNSTLPLWFFGTYYRNVDLPADVPSISDDLLAKKSALAPIYESQTNTVNKFRHMFPHEDWTRYNQ